MDRPRWFNNWRTKRRLKPFLKAYEQLNKSNVDWSKYAVELEDVRKDN